MQFGFSTNAFREYGLGESTGAIADAGYDGVELLFDEPHLYPPETDEAEIDRTLETLAEHNIAISNCNAFMLTAIGDFHHPSFVEPDGVPATARRVHARGAGDGSG